MATDTFPARSTASPHGLTQTQLSASDVVQAIVSPLASLKLTVVLLTLAVAVTFIATLDQTRANVHVVKMKHFESMFVAVPFQTFFVPAWAPSLQSVPGRFFIPSGLSILVMLLINLTAAHSLRFKLKARGTRLWIGLAVALFAGFTTWAVIFNGQNGDGFQAEPPIPYRTMWRLIQGGLLVIAVAAGMARFSMTPDRKIERLLVMLAGAVCLILLGMTLLFGEQAFIGDSAMRILWQLIQATIAAVVAYAACVLLFQRKAGMVLLHLGVAGLMLNEIFVTVTNNEQRMTVFEGDTASQAIDVRATEFSIVNISDSDNDKIISVPESRFRSGNRISDPALPFDIQCIKYLPSSDLRQAIDPDNNLATVGIGLKGEAIEVPSVVGTDSQQTVDFASAYIELFDSKTGASLGTHLVSQQLADERADSVTVDGTEYRILLRFKTEYKPYTLTLKDAVRENYIGTETPRYYGSEVIINDRESGLESNQTIYMNNPLRYADETFYQSGMETLPDGRQYSVLQIVTNVGWMIPYVCCMFTVVGLVAQFGESLLGFLKKQRGKPVPKATLVAAAPGPRASFGPGIWVPGTALILFGGFAFSQMIVANRPAAQESMRLDLLAQVPVTFEGRVQPLDSYARNTARQLRERESVSDGNNRTQPAIKWLADVVFEADANQDYRTFYITDPNIINALGLPNTFLDPKRKNFVFTVDELVGAREKLNELIPNPQEKDPKTWTKLQSRLATLRGKLQRLFGMKLLFGPPLKPDMDWLMRLETERNAMASDLTPLTVPQSDSEQPWLSMTEANSRTWLAGMASELKLGTTTELANSLVETKILPALRDDMVKDRIIQRFMNDPTFLDILEKQHGEKDPRALAALLKSNWESLPERIRVDLFAAEGPLVDAMLAQQVPQLAGRLEQEMLPINGGRKQFTESTLPNTAELLNRLKPAYVIGDAKTFNQTLETYLAQVKSEPPTGYSGFALSLERFYNGFSPFFVAMVIYVAAFLLAASSWLGAKVPLGRAAVALLLLGMTIHGSGIVMRIMISGRPPVTNLYSSVLFVGMVAVGMLILVELITRLGIGSALAGLGGFASLMWAHSMTVIDGDTFTVMVAVLDTTFWLATHVVCISLGYAATFVAGLLGVAYLVMSLVTGMMRESSARRTFSNVMYGFICFGLLASYFGTVLGGLWGDDSWGRFWGWDPKENGALMIVLWNAVLLHARWGGLVKERGLAALAAAGNIVVLWSWKGVNAMGVGLHAYSGTEDKTLGIIVMVGLAHLLIAAVVLIPQQYWMSYWKHPDGKSLT